MSITATASQYVLNALAALLEGKKVFTAHDVKIAARKKVEEDKANEKIYHEDVRLIVHNEFLTGEFPDDYNREEFLELKNGQVAICYYPDGKAATDHDMAADNQSGGYTHQSGGYTQRPSLAPAIGNVPSYVQQAQVAPKAKQGGSVKDGNGFICTETSKGVINIPDIIVKGVTPNGGTYDIQLQNGSIIYKAPDGKGRLRIASSKLGSGDKFRLEIVNNTIKVEQV